DKPALAVRGQSVYVAFNHEEEVWVAASQDGGRGFTSTRVNTQSRPGWSLLGAAPVGPAGNAYLAWASYSKAGGERGQRAARAAAYLLLVVDQWRRKLVAEDQRFLRRAGSRTRFPRDRSGQHRRRPHRVDGCAQHFAQLSILEHLLSQLKQRRSDLGRRNPHLGLCAELSLYRQGRFPFPFRRLFRTRHRQPRRYPRGMGRRPELSVPRLDLARQRTIN